MTTVNDILYLQREHNVLTAPTKPSAGTVSSVPKRTNSNLSITLTNTINSNVYAYITGLDINENAVFLLQSDGQTPYYPTSPSNTTPLLEDCSINLTGVGASRTVTIPRLAGGRIWFSVDQTLTFFLNPGPALVEPSVTNPSDPNYYLPWDFCEFTFDDTQLVANISYVDFVSLPISLTLTNTSGEVQSVAGISPTGLCEIAASLKCQDSADDAGWSNLVISSPSGDTLRVLSPISAIAMNSSLFGAYWQPYVESVWAMYTSTDLAIDTQAQWGICTGNVVAGDLTFPGIGSISQPSSVDIFSCNTGVFATNSAQMANICARITAAFNRATLLVDANQPDGEQESNYYQNATTNHYARIVHAANIDGKGYAFPYDDVSPSNGQDQAGLVSDPSPQTLGVTLGGGIVQRRVLSLKELARQGRQMPGGRRNPRRMKRGLEWGHVARSEKSLVTGKNGAYVLADPKQPDTGQSLAVDQPILPTALVRTIRSWLENLERNPVYARMKPVVGMLVHLGVTLLSTPITRAVFFVIFLLLLALLHILIL